MKSKKKKLTKKQKRLLLIIGIIVFVFLLIIVLTPLRNRKKEENTNVNVDDLNRNLTSIKEVVEYLESTYLYEADSSQTDYEIDIYVSFKYDLYDKDASNEIYFTNFYEKVAMVSNFKSFRIIDEGKNISIEVKCNSNKISEVLINGEVDYFKKQDSKKSQEQELKVDTIDLNVNSEILRKLIDSKWTTSNVNLGTPESTFYKYQVYFDEGYEIRTIQGKVYNIVFTDKYKDYVVADYKVGDSLEKIEAALGTSYKDLVIIGYKTDKFYVFFENDEISIYPNNQYDYTEFEKLVEEYNEKQNINDFMDKLTDIWSDYTSYKYDTNFVEIEYVLKGVKISFSSYEKEGIQIYENYKGNLRVEKRDYKDVYYKLNKSLLIDAEVNRMLKTRGFDDTLYERYPLLYSKKFFITNDLEEGFYKNVKIISLDENFPNNELDDTIEIYKYIWADDSHLVYSIMGQGIYLYNAETRVTEELMLGDDRFEITDYNREQNILTYDGKQVVLKY